jgi:predicted DNA-binding protein
MTTISIPLSDEKRARLQSLADQAGLSPEEYLRRRVESWLDATDTDFLEAARYVLEKNDELYRRLA